MTAAKYIAEKFKEILGTQYEVIAHHAFEVDYTERVKSPYGIAIDFNTAAFEAHKDKIIAVVETHYAALPNVSYALINDTYTVHFWVPVNYETPDNYALKGESGEVAPEPQLFTFDDDMARLAATLKNNKFEFTEPMPQADGTVKDALLRAMLTVSEPALESNNVEKTGAFQRVVFKVSGNILIADKSLETGRDIKISVFNNGKFNPVIDPIDISFGAGTDANGIQSTDKDMTEQDVAASNWQINFKVFGFRTETDPALMIFNKKAILNPQKLTPSASSRRLQKLIHIKVENAGQMRDVWGVLSVTITATGNTGIVRYDVSITDSGLSESMESVEIVRLGGFGGDYGDGDYSGIGGGIGDDDGGTSGKPDEPDEPDEPDDKAKIDFKIAKLAVDYREKFLDGFFRFELSDDIYFSNVLATGTANSGSGGEIGGIDDPTWQQEVDSLGQYGSVGVVTFGDFSLGAGTHELYVREIDTAWVWGGVGRFTLDPLVYKVIITVVKSDGQGSKDGYFVNVSFQNDNRPFDILSSIVFYNLFNPS